MNWLKASDFLPEPNSWCIVTTPKKEIPRVAFYTAKNNFLIDKEGFIAPKNIDKWARIELPESL